MPTPSLVRRFARNTTGRDIIVGDVHGSYTALNAALREIGFSAVPGGDRLFIAGDLVDRGPESLEAPRWLDQPGIFAVGGNHDDMAVRWPNGHMDPRQYAANGGAWMMALDRETQLEVAATLGALPVAIELETEQGLVGIVHACCPVSRWQDFTAALEDPALSNNQRNALIDEAQWSRARFDSEFRGEVSGVRAVVVGHQPLQHMTSLGNTIYIDTMGWRPRGHFTLLDAATLKPLNKPPQVDWSDSDD